MLGWKMYGKFLQCDECSAVIDRRAKDDFGGQYRDTVARGTFAPSEWPELLAYARSLGWYISDDTHNGRHVCPAHPRS